MGWATCLKIVSETKNFTAATEKLGVSSSAVSQTIKLLEQRLGVALLARTTRSTSLTEIGKKFLDQAGPVLDRILAALEDGGDLYKTTFWYTPSQSTQADLFIFSQIDNFGFYTKTSRNNGRAVFSRSPIGNF